MLSLKLCILFTCCYLGATHFLRDGPTFPNERLNMRDVRSALQKEIEAATGHNTSHDVVKSIEKDFRTMFAALPKNQYGNLGTSAARYALNRAFLKRHGWQVRGLEPSSGSFNSSTPTVVLKDKVPALVEELFEKQLNGRGFGLHELAVFTAAIEHLVSAEAEERLKATYKLLNIPEDTKVTTEQMDRIMDVYMLISIIGGDVSTMNQESLAVALKNANAVYPAWSSTQDFAKEVRRGIVYAPFTLFTDSGYDFATTKKVVEAFGKQYGRFQNQECQAMKTNMLKAEEQSSGRVKLGDFYSQMGAPRFPESTEYLRELNVLDEWEKDRPRVIVPNYITASTNCIGSSGLYSICCANQCEGILTHLESKLRQSWAQPRRIARVVSALPSATVPANRQLAPSLIKHLDMIATHHQGHVPLHSRLFAQWLHHAYPRECPLPGPAGKSRPMNEREWMETKGTPIVATEHEIEQAIKSQRQHMTEGEKMLSDIGREEVEDLPWTTEEELVVVQETLRHGDFSFFSIMRNVAFIGILAAAWIYILDTIGTIVGASKVPGKPTYGKRPAGLTA